MSYLRVFQRLYNNNAVETERVKARLKIEGLGQMK